MEGELLMLPKVIANLLDPPHTNNSESTDRIMNPFRPTAWAFVLALLLATASLAETYRFEQGTNGYTGFRDTTLFQDLPSNAGGGIDGIFSGTIRTSFLRRALLSADLSSIPTDAVVLSVRLEMVVERSGGNFGDITYGLHRVQRAWGEGEAVIPDEPGGLGAPAAVGDATWNDARFTQEVWSTAGGDFSSVASATASAGQQGSTVTWESPDLTADVQAWVANPAANFGWAIITPDEGIIQRVKKFFSSEAAVNRPVLVVETEDAVEPPTGDGLGLWFWLAVFWLLRWWFGSFRGGLPG
jgi:hypothetical protein